MSTIFNAAIELAEQGYSVIPVDRATKKPCIPWKEYQSRIATEEEIESWWEQFPEANVAIITGGISCLAVVDADSDTGIEWMLKHCTKTTVYAKTGKGKHAYYTYPYHTAVKNAVKIAPDVDVRGEGGYVVAPPSIHASGKQYEWEIVGGGWDDLPEFEPINGFKTLFDESTGEKTKGGNLNVNLSGVKTAPINTGVEKGSRNNTLAQLVGKWAKAGLEIDEIDILAKEWNKKNAPPLGAKEVDATLRSIWKRHFENDPEPLDVPEYSSDIIPVFEMEEEKALSEQLLHPGGILEEIMDYIEENSAVSVPIFSLSAALSFLGAIAGQKFMTETGLRTNLYCISLGCSGSGKNGALATLPLLLRNSIAAEIAGPTELTSDTAVLSWIAKETGHNCWFCLDEIGQVLKGMQNPASPQAGIPRLLTSLFSSTDRPTSKGYAQSANNIYIPWHHTSLYGTTTPDRFWESIRGAEVADGFLARLLVFHSDHDAPFPKPKKKFSLPKELIQKLNDIYNVYTETDKSSGNIPNLHVPIPNILPLEDGAASQLADKFARFYHDLKNKHKTDEIGKASIYGRAAEHMNKIAMVVAVSSQGAKVTSVDVNSVRYACYLIQHLTDSLIKNIEKNISETEVSTWKNKILKAIRDVMQKKKQKGEKENGATLRDLQRGRCSGLKSKDLQELINDLLIAEKIVKIKKVSNGKDIIKFYVV